VADTVIDQAGEQPERLPALLMVNGDSRVQKVLVDEKLLRETRRCRESWHSLQELGGIHNSYAERVREEERRLQAEQAAAAAGASESANPEPAGLEAAATEAAVAEPEPESEPSPDEPYIETARCTTCNECTQINDKMFVYNENRQAYIADPDAGTYAELVEAAESCQVSIIHPGKPRNPDEPGLEELVARAEPFL
ncbi:MAG: ferredoxin, partial [Gammaproteobacteria bacterium]